jgi:[protein-PII] uridylyltransferase
MSRCLLHDIGKGRDEDHSILGAQIARKVCAAAGPETRRMRHGRMAGALSPADVGHGAEARHLRPAHRARLRQGGEDAGAAGSADVLTVCDIRGGGPGTWNNWKATLICAALYRQTATRWRRARGLNREQRGGRGARSALREALADWAQKALKTEIDRHYPPYWQGLDVATQVTFAELLRDLDDDEIRIDTPRTSTATPRASVSRWPTIPASSRASPARWPCGRERRRCAHLHHQGRLRHRRLLGAGRRGQPLRGRAPAAPEGMIGKTLKGEVVARDALAGATRSRKRERPFDVPTISPSTTKAPRSTRSSRSTPATGPACSMI